MILSPVKNRSLWLRPRVSQWFGQHKEYYAQFGSQNGHSGIDFPLNEGTELYAPFSGKVTVQKNHKNYGYNIRIKNDKLECILAHLSGSLITDGDYVSMGSPVALSGNTGNSTGPHLHFAVRHLSPDGKPMYPNNGNFGFEDLAKYTICWWRTLK